MTLLDKEDETKRISPEVSKFREALPQFLAVGTINLLLFNLGTSLGFSTILIPELQKAEPAVPVTLDQMTWIGSIHYIFSPFGSFASGPITQKIGRRRSMMAATLPFAIAWLLYYNATDAKMLFMAQAFTGFSGGFLEAPVITYVAEVSQPHLRGLLSASTTISIIFGIFSQMLAGSLISWRIVILINLTYPVICLFALYFVPESPSWLADKGYMQEAEKSLCWLRGWVTSSHVKNEFCNLCKAFDKPVRLTTINSIISEENNLMKDQSIKKSWHFYKKKTCYLPFLLITWIFFILTFGGSRVLQVFAVIIFDELKTPINKYKATVIMGIGEILGVVSCIFLIHFTGKRKLSFLSAFTTGLFFMLISLYGYLIMYSIIDTEEYTWMPTSLVVGTAFMSHLCLQSLPWMLIGEVFPPEVQNLAAGSVITINYIFNSITNKLFIYMKNGMTLSGTFLFYGSINIVGVVVLYFILPETEGRTLKHIRDHYSGVQKLTKKRPNKKIQAFKEQLGIENLHSVEDNLISRL